MYLFKSFVRFQLYSVIRNGRLPSKNSPKVFDFHPEFWHIDRQPKLDEGQQTKQQQQQSLLSFSQFFPGRGVANTSLGGPVYKNLLQTMQIIEMHFAIKEEKNGVNV